MPIARFQMPDGRVARFEVPEGTTPEQAQSMIAAELPNIGAPEAANQKSKPQPEGMRGGKLDALLTGIRDPIDAGAQMLPRWLEFLSSAGGNVQNPISNFLGGETKRVDAMTSQNEREYQAAREAQGREGFDATRLAGNVASPVNLALGARVPQAVSLAGKMGYGAATGGAMGALQPVTENQKDFSGEKAKQIAGGLIAGSAMPLVTGGLARIVRPNTRPEVASLMKEGITPTPGQVLGGAAQFVEDKAMSMPILGQAITNGRKRGLEQFNAASLNKALAPIGQTLPKNVNPGYEGIEYVGAKLGQAYDDLLPKLKIKADAKFADDLQNLRKLSGNMNAEQADQFERILQNEVLGKFTPSGLMAGETMKQVESRLGQLSRGFGKSDNYNQRMLGDSIEETQAQLRQLVERGNPMWRGQLSKINDGWAKFKRLQRAASYTGAEEGVFSPAQLRNAVKAMDQSKDKAKFAKGQAVMQEWADTGKNVLGSHYPDSGTAGRTLLSLGTLGGGYLVHPGIAAAELATTIPYMPGIQRGVAGLLASRPESAKSVADAVRKFGPAATPLLLPLGQGLLD